MKTNGQADKKESKRKFKALIVEGNTYSGRRFFDLMMYRFRRIPRDIERGGC